MNFGIKSFTPYDMVCALLPEHSNVQISTVRVQNSIPEEITYTKYTQMIETASRDLDHKSFMCLMLFCDKNSGDLALSMAKIAKSTFDHNKRVSLCGGQVEQLRTNNETAPPYCVALLITGSIKTWSIVLDLETIKLSHQKLQKFKKQVKLRNRAVGFVFFSRWLLRNVQDEEFPIFRALFLDVSLIGCSSIFEFGRETATYEARFLGVQNKNWVKSLTITFMILTYD